MMLRDPGGQPVGTVAIRALQRNNRVSDRTGPVRVHTAWGRLEIQVGAQVAALSLQMGSPRPCLSVAVQR